MRMRCLSLLLGSKRRTAKKKQKTNVSGEGVDRRKAQSMCELREPNKRCEVRVRSRWDKGKGQLTCGVGKTEEWKTGMAPS